jgi:hypothetical protein
MQNGHIKRHHEVGGPGGEGGVLKTEDDKDMVMDGQHLYGGDRYGLGSEGIAAAARARGVWDARHGVGRVLRKV